MLGTNRPRNGGGKEGKSIAKNLRDYDEMFTAFCAAGMNRDAAAKKAMALIAEGHSWDDLLLQARIAERAGMPK